jgi:hypothetical protein
LADDGDGFNPALASTYETLFITGNGYLGSGLSVIQA